jgi:hypothetical protein
MDRACGYTIQQDQRTDGLILKAAIEAAQPEQALKLKTAVEAPAPAEKKLQSDYWLNRARLEAIQKHTQDALAYYQLALITRTDAPRHGAASCATTFQTRLTPYGRNRAARKPRGPYGANRKAARSRLRKADGKRQPNRFRSSNFPICQERPGS